MATLKVKQFRDDVWIPDNQAQEILEARDAGTAPKMYTFGSALQIFSEDIRFIMLDTHPDSPRRASPQKTERDMSYMSRKRTPEQQERVNEELKKIRERFKRDLPI